MKKRFLLGLCLAMIALAGCSAGNPGNSPAASPDGRQAENGQTEAASEEPTVTLKFMHWWSYITDEVIAVFEEENPHIKIESQYVAGGDPYSTKVQALASINDLPDVLGVGASVATELINQGKLLNLSDAAGTPAYDSDQAWIDTQAGALLASMNNRYNNSQNLTEELKPANGHIWSLPFGAISLAVIYNKTIFHEVGIEPPVTWEQFMDNNDKLRAAGYVPLAHAGKVWRNWWVDSIVDQTARDITADVYLEGAVRADDERLAAGFSIFADMVARGHFDQGAVTAGIEDAQALFVQQRAAQFYVVPENFVTYLKDNIPAGVELGAFVLPGAAGQPVRSIGGASNMVAVSANTQHQEAAIAFTKFLTSSTIFQLLADQHVVPSVQGYEPPAGDEIMGAYAQAYSNGFFVSHMPPWTPDSNKIWDTEIISGILIGQLSGEEAARQIQELWEKDPNHPSGN